MSTDQIQIDLESVTGARPLPTGESFSDVLARLDQIAQSDGLSENMRHYLSRRSYVKALEWLANPDTPHRQ